MQLNGHPDVIVCDGQKGMLKAIKEVFPRVLVQRCQFHILQRSRILLTRNHETIQAIELKEIVEQIPRIQTKEQLKIFLTNYINWKNRYKEYLKEKTYPLLENMSSNTSNQRKWFYTHKQLRSADYLIKKAIPNLFKYLDNRNIPNTSNHVEGGVNSHLKLLLRLHRGLPINKRKYLVANFLSQKQ